MKTYHVTNNVRTATANVTAKTLAELRLIVAKERQVMASILDASRDANVHHAAFATFTANVLKACQDRGLGFIPRTKIGYFVA